MKAASTPDPTAFDPVRLIEDHQAGVWRYLRALGCESNLAEDLTQETFLAVLQRPFQDYNAAATAAYLRRTAYNALVSFQRRAKKVTTVENIDELNQDWESWAGDDNGEELIDALRHCLTVLSDRARLALELRFGERASRETIAATLGMSEHGARNLMQRAEEDAPRMHRKQTTMSDKPDDPIIDACLEEVLGGQSPPDLTARILQAWQHVGSNVIAPTSSASSPSDVSASPAQQPTAAIKLREPKATANSRRTASPWLAIAASLAIVGLGGAIVWVVWDATELRSRRSNQIVAPEVRPRPSHMPPGSSSTSIVDNSPVPQREVPSPAIKPTAVPISSVPENALVIEPMRIAEGQAHIAEVNIPDERPARLPDEQIVRAINELIRNHWVSGGITPAEPIADDGWCRRVHLKLLGREPSPQELASFVESRSPRKREELVNILLQGETYIEEFAAHWSRTWSGILLASGDKRASREGLEQYLRRAFGQGQPFSNTTYELLTATGSGTIGDANYNGATNFLVAHSDREGVYAQATAHVSRTFMGLSLECSQCHVDSTWSGNEQRQFWELNAFFQQLKIDRNRDRNSLVSDADAEYADGETYYTLPDGLVRAAYPVFVDGTEIPRHPSVAQVNRRDLLAKFVTRSEQFRQAMANRFWAELFGVGFTIPADNIGPHNPPSHPELLAKLGGQFAAHDYDVRALIRWIVLSEPFALSSGDVAMHDQIGAKLAFDCFPQAIDNRGPVLNQLRVAQEAYASFVSKSGANSTPARITPAITPGVVPMELSDVDKLLATVATEARQLSRSTVYGIYILESDMSLEQKVQHMFFATLHRAPSASEQKAVADVLANNSGPADHTALEYIWWALASSQEAAR